MNVVNGRVEMCHVGAAGIRRVTSAQPASGVSRLAERKGTPAGAGPHHATPDVLA